LLNPGDLSEPASFTLIDDDERFAPGWYFLDLEDPVDGERKPSERGPVYELKFAVT